MIAVTNPNVSQKVISIIGKVVRINPFRLKTSYDLIKEFKIDTLDLVNIIWELEKSFKIDIPDEVPLNTVADFVEFVAAHTKNDR